MDFEYQQTIVSYRGVHPGCLARLIVGPQIETVGDYRSYLDFGGGTAAFVIISLSF